jgi:cytochrome c553
MGHRLLDRHPPQRPARRQTAVVSFALLALLSATGPARSAARDDSAAVEYFEKKVRPLLVANCYTCHSADTNSKGGLRIDDRNGLIVGGSRGPAIVPGKPDESLLIQAVGRAGKLKMPPERRLGDNEVAVLRKWIRDGAAWTKVEGLPADHHVTADYTRLRQAHWAWQPVRDRQPPRVADSAWPRDAIDQFLLARMTEKGLKPVADAVGLPLIRRATFDLTGLPPTLAELDAFSADHSSQAFERLVDRLLASPAFGERWGRHWLDVARYAESTGSARNLPFPHAWRYRDYVIDAFNNDKPYDEFIREQIAGDLLPAATSAERAEHLIATGFLALGMKDVNQRFKVRYIMDNIDEQIDTVTRSVLALTASCARCHDHKFDPIPTRDYYALAGIFHSSDLCAALRSKMGGGGLDYYDPQMILRLAPGADSVKPAANAPVALGVRDAKIVADTAVRIRGIAEKHGPMVPRGFLSVVHYAGQPAVNNKQSGRLELAEWLTSSQNPLAARVIVNRVWHHLFGEGLVKTVDNFGVTGDVPSHPDLLDHLATRFIRDGWSIKRLVRAIVLTRAYQLSSEATEENAAVDPENEFLWRHTPRRLDAEEIRDATLAAAGELDLTRPVGSPAMNLPVIELTNNGAQAKRLTELAQSSRHRSVYLPLLRGLTPQSLAVFDFAEQGMVTGNRDTTTVAPQALYLLNDPFMQRQSRTLANRVLQPAKLSDAERIDLAYRLALGRHATTAETGRVTAFLADYTAATNDARLAAHPASTPAPTLAKSSAAKAARAKNQKRATRKVVAKSARLQSPRLHNANPRQPDPVSGDESATATGDPRPVAWTSFCQALFDAAEFRYLR